MCPTEYTSGKCTIISSIHMGEFISEGPRKKWRASLNENNWKEYEKMTIFEDIGRI